MHWKTYERAVVVLMAFAALALPQSTGATVARQVSFDQKVDQAETILLGKCLNTESSFDPTGKWIVTRATFQVEKSIKGNAGQTIEVVLPGGTVGGIHQETVGVPSFQTGDERVLFVKRNAIGPSVLYMDQGSYEVQKDSAGRRSVAPVSSDLVLLDSQSGKVAPAESIRTLESFEREVSAAAQRVGAERLKRGALGSMRPREKNWRQETAEFLDENRVLLIVLAIGMIIAVIPLVKRR